MKGSVFYACALYEMKRMMSSKSSDMPEKILSALPTSLHDLYAVPGMSMSKIVDNGDTIIMAVEKFKKLLGIKKDVSPEKAVNIYPEIHCALNDYKTKQVIPIKDYCEQINKLMHNAGCDFAINQKMILCYLKDNGIVDSLSYNMLDKDSIVFSDMGRKLGFSLIKMISGKVAYYSLQMSENAFNFLDKHLWNIFYKYYASNPINYMKLHPDTDFKLPGEAFMFISGLRKEIEKEIVDYVKKMGLPIELLEYFGILNIKMND